MRRSVHCGSFTFRARYMNYLETVQITSLDNKTMADEIPDGRVWREGCQYRRITRELTLMSEESAQEWAARLPTQSRRSTRNAARQEHSSEDLSHVRVAHRSLAEMEAGHSEVLVLDDQLVEEGEDALVSLERRDMEAAEKRIAAKRKMRQSNPYDDEIDQPVRMGQARSLLRKYDEEDDETELTIGSKRQAAIDNPIDESMPVELKKRNVRRKVISFTDEPIPSSFSANPLALMDNKPLALDDDDLQQSLAKTRRYNIKEFIQQEDLATEKDPVTIEGVIFSESTDFINSVKVQNLVHFEQDMHVESPPEILAVPDKPIDAPFEQEPLVRRGVCAALQYLAKLGIRPQLSNEAIAPQQRSRLARFADIKIEHHDEDGNLLTPKEAYKLLSHKFHGKTPGKGKLEKIRRKKEQSKTIQSFSLDDTPLRTASALRERQRTTGSTHIVLSKGSHAVPSEEAPAKPKAKVPAKTVERKPRIFGMK
ncbi:hypothetical protein PSACC_03271 [Paramicrosporidium saccamoebae]|uniref:Uncharacterized protein n=1 Tax=Paramicrosporidium saccamoebae TaxID=1246581 RepID=A0A2H9TGP7_9FUNG|nr:hypothetical protein PSACC_03271 [Paramicrosporidium saccamoebae]